MMVHFYSAINESILTSSITIWYPAATARADCSVLSAQLKRRLRSIRTKTSRHKNSFFPCATGLLNKARGAHKP
ncbi:hypothetical protein DPEC_G00014510 [Dallia pectoralis]|uniref:Uncharacterized protein n=1 Tax=Dallia pectoralis TaxID=75939 RepID=A0ACC2HN70_DALPE|nr:hypothetical protein DPEC_G00014510 [Dallia pectoralis]